MSYDSAQRRVRMALVSAAASRRISPRPRGLWGIVFTGDVGVDGRPVLIALAFGVRHPSRAWQPSVYQVAHSRLNG